jgi:hypothetical protein
MAHALSQTENGDYIIRQWNAFEVALRVMFGVLAILFGALCLAMTPTVGLVKAKGCMPDVVLFLFALFVIYSGFWLLAVWRIVVIRPASQSIEVRMGLSRLYWRSLYHFSAFHGVYVLYRPWKRRGGVYLVWLSDPVSRRKLELDWFRSEEAAHHLAEQVATLGGIAYVKNTLRRRRELWAND